MFEPKGPKSANVKNGFSSSGFQSDFSSQTNHRPTSSIHTATEKTSGLGMTTTNDPSTATYLTNLWGKSAVETSRHRVSMTQSPKQLPQAPPRSHIPSSKSTPTLSTQARVSEFDILRDLVFVMNGVNGQFIRFDQGTDRFQLAPKLSLTPGERDSVQRIAECGWLLNRIRQFVDTVQRDQSYGLMAQSLASSLQENLSEYYRLLTTLESQIGRESRGAPGPISETPPDSDSDENRVPRLRCSVFGNEAAAAAAASSVAQRLTLVRLSSKTHKARHHLRLLANVCDACRTKRGGDLASQLYAYTQSGDPVCAAMSRVMLKSVASALLRSISSWIYDGQLDDQRKEFFVESNPSIQTERLWHDKYRLRHEMIPVFITPLQASKILLTGKSINFLQYACGEKKTLKDREAIRNSRLQRVESLFEQAFDRTFDQMISTVYKQTSGFLLETLINRYHFLDHLRATRQFLLLGQGDFITHLMDLLSDYLSEPASELLLHQLSNTLESAIRATNAQYEQPEILQRLDVGLLEMSSDDTGWDVFSLDYHIDGPLATVFTDECRRMYLRAFNFLWRAKRMEFSLSSLWKDQFLMSRMEHGLHADLEPILHLSEMFGAELRHCVQQIQYYVNFEVLECAWDILVKRIHAATDLDQVIDAHHAFLSNVITQCLLDAPSRQLIGQLRTVFNLILNFTELHAELCEVAKGELALRERYANEVAELTRRGNWGTNESKELQEKARRLQFVQQHVGQFQAQIRILASSYRGMIMTFIQMLCTHPDQNLRFLAEHLNFNGHYQYGRGYSSGTGVDSTADEVGSSLATTTRSLANLPAYASRATGEMYCR